RIGSESCLRSRASAWLTADWVRPRRAAARVTLRSARSTSNTTRRLRSNRRRSISFMGHDPYSFDRQSPLSFIGREIAATDRVKMAIFAKSATTDRRTVIEGLGALAAGGVILSTRAPAEADVPQLIVNNLVTAGQRHWNGRDCLAVELTAE